MNRLEELKQLKHQQHDLPSSLDNLVNQEVHHYYQYQKRKKFIYYPMISLCSILITLILTFNLFPTVAYACKDIPVLEDFAKSLCFNQTVKDCIDNDYAIYVHQTDKDITLEYMVIDEKQMTFYLKGCQLDHLENINYIKKGENYSQAILSESQFIKIQCIYDDINQINFDDYLTFTLNQKQYQFSIKIDKNKIKKTKSMTINKDIIVHNQKLTLQKIEVSPSITKVYIQADPNNTLIFDDAYISIRKNNKVYTNANGIYSQQINDTTKVFIIDSPYFQNNYTLSFHHFAFISPQYDHCSIDIQNKTINHLPKDMQIDDFVIKDNQIKITLSANNPFASYSFVNQYYDNHKKIDLNHQEFGNIEKNGKIMNYQMIEIPYQQGHQYELDIDYKQVYPLYESIDIHEESLK